MVWVLAFGAFAVGTGLFALGGVLPSVATSVHASIGAVGQSVTVYAVTYALSAPVIATLVSRFPARYVLITALTIFALANLLTAFAPNLLILLLSRVLAGIGAAGYMPIALSAAAGAVPPERRGAALGTVTSGLNGSLAVGIPIGIVLAQYSSWRSAVILVAILAAGAAVVIFLTLRRLPASPRTSLRASGNLLRSKRFVSVLAVTVLSTASGISAYTYIAPILASTVGATGWTFLALLILYGIGAFTGTIISGRLTDRFGANRVVTGALALLIVILILVPVVHVLAAFAFLVTIWGVAFVATTTPQQVRIVGTAPASPAVAISLNSSGIYIGQALGAAAGGLFLAVGLEVTLLPFAAAGIAAVTLLVHAAASRTEAADKDHLPPSQTITK